MKGVIVGIQVEGGEKAYRILVQTGNNEYSKQLVSEGHLIDLVNNWALRLSNATVDKGWLVGTTGSLSRFIENKHFKPMVILSEIVAEYEGTQETLGYRLASYEGVVRAERIKEVLSYCKRVSYKGEGAPIQNAIYVEESDNVKAHLRCYPNGAFPKEVIHRRKASTVKQAVVDKAENTRQISRAEDIFSKEQLVELRLGKQNGVDIKVYGNNKLSAEQMGELRLALEQGVKASLFADPAFKAEVMKAYRITARYGVDITHFVNPQYNEEQIFELSTGYLAGVDIEEFSDPKLSANDMAKKRIYLENKLWAEVEAQQV